MGMGTTGTSPTGRTASQSSIEENRSQTSPRTLLAATLSSATQEDGRSSPARALAGCVQSEAFFSDASFKDFCMVRSFDRTVSFDTASLPETDIGSVVEVDAEAVVGSTAASLSDLPALSCCDQFHEDALKHLFECGSLWKGRNLSTLYAESDNAYAKISIGDFAEVLKVSWDAIDAASDLDVDEKAVKKQILHAIASDYLGLMQKEGLGRKSAFGAFYSGHKSHHDARLKLEGKLLKHSGMATSKGRIALQQAFFKAQVLPAIRQMVEQRVGGELDARVTLAYRELIDARVNETLQTILAEANDYASRQPASIRGAAKGLELIALLPECLREFIDVEAPAVSTPETVAAPSAPTHVTGLSPDSLLQPLRRSRSLSEPALRSPFSLAPSIAASDGAQAAAMLPVQLHPAASTGKKRDSDNTWQAMLNRRSQATQNILHESGPNADSCKLTAPVLPKWLPRGSYLRNDEPVELSWNRSPGLRNTGKAPLRGGSTLVAINAIEGDQKLGEIKETIRKYRDGLQYQETRF